MASPPSSSSSSMSKACGGNNGAEDCETTTTVTTTLPAADDDNEATPTPSTNNGGESSLLPTLAEADSDVAGSAASARADPRESATTRSITWTAEEERTSRRRFEALRFRQEHQYNDVVRRHYERQGYLVKSGLQFGAEFVLYASDPTRVHSDFCVHVVPPGGAIDWRTLQILVRSMPGVHKHLLVASLIRCSRRCRCGSGPSSRATTDPMDPAKGEDGEGCGKGGEQVRAVDADCCEESRWKGGEQERGVDAGAGGDDKDRTARRHATEHDNSDDERDNIDRSYEIRELVFTSEHAPFRTKHQQKRQKLMLLSPSSSSASTAAGAGAAVAAVTTTAEDASAAAAAAAIVGGQSKRTPRKGDRSHKGGG